MNLAHIGDVVLTLPAVTALKSRHPSTHFTLLAGPGASDLGRGHAGVDEVLEFAAPWWRREAEHRHAAIPAVFALADRMREGRFDTVINFKSFFQENLAAALSGIPHRVGYGLYGGGFLHTRCLEFPWGEHTVFQHLRLAAELGCSETSPAVGLRPLAEDEAWAESLLGGAAFPTIGIHAGAGTPAKQWPVERWVALANALHVRYGGTVVVVGGPEEGPLAERVRSESRARVVIATGRGVLSTAAVLRRCVGFVGGDSAPAHLAAAVGTPTLALFSGTNRVQEWRPWGTHVEVLQERPECSPCGLAHCSRADHACMTRIEVARVLEVFGALVERAGTIAVGVGRPAARTVDRSQTAT